MPQNLLLLKGAISFLTGQNDSVMLFFVVTSAQQLTEEPKEIPSRVSILTEFLLRTSCFWKRRAKTPFLLAVPCVLPTDNPSAQHLIKASRAAPGAPELWEAVPVRIVPLAVTFSLRRTFLAVLSHWLPSERTSKKGNEEKPGCSSMSCQSLVSVISLLFQKLVTG